MFDRFFGPSDKAETTVVERPAPPPPSDGAGDTATVRRIVAKLEAMPPEQARLLASAAYTLARAANADLDISDEETAAIERELQGHEAIDEATAVLVTEMAKLQAKTVGGTEDYVVTREFKDARRRRPADRVVLRACFAVMAANGTISAEETGDVNEIADELDIDAGRAQRDPRRVPRAVLVGPADPARHPGPTVAPQPASTSDVDARGRPRRRPLAPGGDRQPRRSGASRRPTRAGSPATGSCSSRSWSSRTRPAARWAWASSASCGCCRRR